MSESGPTRTQVRAAQARPIEVQIGPDPMAAFNLQARMVRCSRPLGFVKGIDYRRMPTRIMRARGATPLQAALSLLSVPNPALGAQRIRGIIDYWEHDSGQAIEEVTSELDRPEVSYVWPTQFVVINTAGPASDKFNEELSRMVGEYGVVGKDDEDVWERLMYGRRR